MFYTKLQFYCVALQPLTYIYIVFILQLSQIILHCIRHHVDVCSADILRVYLGVPPVTGITGLVERYLFNFTCANDFDL